MSAARRIGLIVWAVYGLGAIVALAASFATTPAALDGGHTPLGLLGALIRPHERCALCDMTHAFCALAHGRWDEAVAYHRLAPTVYVATWLLALSAIPCALLWRRSAD
ncbi:MAG: DUF2752 domain-containing protein [Armatimonadota bacterium]